MISDNLLEKIKADFENTINQFPLFGIVDYEYRGEILVFVCFTWNLHRDKSQIKIKSFEVYTRDWDVIDYGIDGIRSMIENRIKEYLNN